jgi:hypothetical protein
VTKFTNGVYVTKTLSSVVVLTNVQHYEESGTGKDFWLVCYEYGGIKYKKTLLQTKDLDFLIRIGSL